MELSIAKRKAYELLKAEGLLKRGWKIVFDDSRVRLGGCIQEKKVITLSRYFIALNPDEVTEETIAHEIAHGKTPWDDDHGPAWQAEAIRLGAAPEALAYEAVAPEGDYVGICPECARRQTRLQAPDNIDRLVCHICCRLKNDGKPSRKFLLVWTNDRKGEIYRNGHWEKNISAAVFEIEKSPVAIAFKEQFGPKAIIGLDEVGKLPAFRFKEYDFRYKSEGVFRAFLEVKMWRDVGRHRVLKTYWRIMDCTGVVIDVWRSQFTDRYETADKRVDVERLAVGKWYELIVMETGRGYPRLQTAKTSR
jgi:hypothetical protein